MKYVIWVLFLAGCAKCPLAFSYEGSDNGYNQAQIAAAEWRNVCGSDITVSRGGNDIPLREHDAANLGPGSPDYEGSTAAGKTVMSGDDVKSIDFIGGPRGQEVMTHEFGHALGIKWHLDSGIMAASEKRAPGLHVTPRECSEVSQ